MENNILSASVKAIDKATKNIKSFIESIVDAESFVETDVFLNIELQKYKYGACRQTPY